MLRGGLCQLGFAPAEVMELVMAGGGVGPGLVEISKSLAVGLWYSKHACCLSTVLMGGMMHSWRLLWFLGETEAFVLHWSLLHSAGRPCRGGGMQHPICSRDHPDQPM